MVPILLGLLAALFWGGSDFCGAVASRNIGALRAVLFSEIAGLVLLLAALPLVREPLPVWSSLAFSFTAGLIGCLGLLLLFRAMISGPLSTAAPISALLSAVVPILVGAVSEGLPGFLRWGGFGLALAAVWLFAQAEAGPSRPNRLAELGLPLLSGLCFGLYFVLMHQAGLHSTLWALISGRSGGALMLSTGLFLRRKRNRSSQPAAGGGLERGALLAVGLAALLDVGANLAYLLAGQVGRMDVAAVLSALYPGGTVLLAWLILKERLQARQAAGIVVALAAIVLMTI